MSTRVLIVAFGAIAGAQMNASGGITTILINHFTHIEIDNGISSNQETHQNNNPGGWTNFNTDGYSSGTASAQQVGSLVSDGLYQTDMESNVDGDIGFLSNGAYLAQTHYEVWFTLTSSYTYSMIGSALAFQGGDQDRFANTVVSLTDAGTNTTTFFATEFNGSSSFNTSGLLVAGTYKLVSDSTAWVDLGSLDDAFGRAATDFTFRLTEVPGPSGMLAILAFAGIVGTPRRARRGS